VAAELIDNGVEAVIVTKGAEGCEIFTPLWTEKRQGVRAQVVDTVGAGDTFTGAILCGLHEQNAATRGSLRSLEKSTFLEIADTALLAAAIVCGRQGANPPWRRELGA
jgi:fructokinase